MSNPLKKTMVYLGLADEEEVDDAVAQVGHVGGDLRGGRLLPFPAALRRGADLSFHRRPSA